jgi:cytochrome c oxidase subunit II
MRGFLPGKAGTTSTTDGTVALWVDSWIVLLLVGGITWALIIWAVIMYRRRKGQTGLPVQLRYNMPIEVFYTALPLILVLGFFAFTVKQQDAVEATYKNPDVTVEVVGKQWAWDFNYVNANVYSPGIQAQSGAGTGTVVEKDIPTLYLPVDSDITIELKSRDVAHSFWVIDFLYKKDLIPGKTNYMSVHPERTGTYAGKCAELCGEYHSSMLFNVKVVTKAKYAAYIASLKAAGNVGQLSDTYNRNSNDPGNTAPATDAAEG